MKAGRLFEFNKPVRIVDVDDPKILEPWDVIVRIGGAGICRTDLHIQKEGEGKLALPYTLGHENSGWVEEVGPAVKDLSKGEPVILHPSATCGFCRACREGNDMYCANRRSPGLDGTTNGGYAELLRISARSVIKLPKGTDPVPLAPFADAGITAYHAVKKISSLVTPMSSIAVIGIGGLGHFAVQLLNVMTNAKVIGLDIAEDRLKFAKSMGADEVVLTGEDGGVKELKGYNFWRGLRCCT